MQEYITAPLLDGICNALTVFIDHVIIPPPSIVQELVDSLRAYRDEFNQQLGDEHYSKDYAKHLQNIMNLGLNDPNLANTPSDYVDDQGIPLFDTSLVRKFCSDIANFSQNLKTDYHHGCLEKQHYDEMVRIIEKAKNTRSI